MLMSPPAVVALIALPALTETVAAVIVTAPLPTLVAEMPKVAPLTAPLAVTEISPVAALLPSRAKMPVSAVPVTAAVVILIALIPFPNFGKDASAVSHDGAAACVDSDTGVGTIGLRRYAITLATGSGDSADCVIAGAADDDIATSATGSIGLDAVPCGAGDSVGCSDSVYRDVAACRVSEDTASACSGDGVSARIEMSPLAVVALIASPASPVTEAAVIVIEPLPAELATMPFAPPEIVPNALLMLIFPAAEVPAIVADTASPEVVMIVV